MRTIPRNWNENQRRGYLLAREFVILQFYVWAAVSLSAFVYLIVQSSYRQNLGEALTIGLIGFLVTYFPVQYIRVVYAAWQIWKGYVEPPEVTAEQEKDQAKAYQDAIGKLAGGN